MKVTIERTHGKEPSFWWYLLLDLNPREAFFPKAYHRLYATLGLTNEEKFVIKKTNRDFVRLVEEEGEYIPNIYAVELTKGKRTCVFKHQDIQWVNKAEELLRDGLKKWKADIDGQATYFEKPKAKQSYEL